VGMTQTAQEVPLERERGDNQRTEGMKAKKEAINRARLNTFTNCVHREDCHYERQC